MVIARMFRKARIGRAAIFPHNNCACANRPSNVSSMPQDHFPHQARCVTLSSDFQVDTNSFSASTITAELRKIYFSSVKVLNRSVDISVQKSEPSLPNFLYSNRLIRFAPFQCTCANFFPQALLSTTSSDDPAEF